MFYSNFFLLFCCFNKFFDKLSTLKFKGKIMYKILIQDKCKCFLNSNLNGSFEFSSKDDALFKAIEIKNIMNKTFCKKHNFQIQEIFNNLVIKFYKDEPLSSCCGNGCCM